MSTQPQNRRSSLDWRQHEYGLCHEAVESLRIHAPIPIEGPVTLAQVIEGYKNYVEKRPYGDDRHFQDPALITAWAGKPELAAKLFEWGLKCHKRAVIGQEKEPGKSAAFYIPTWRDDLKERITNPEALRKTVEEQVIFHKLAKIPYEPLIIDL